MTARGQLRLGRGSARLDRRTALRGIGSVVALPWLEAMAPVMATAARAAEVDAVERPRRLCYVFFPNGVHYEDWKPIGAGPEFALSPLLEPLERHRGEILVVSGLEAHNAQALGDGPGDHARSAACFLTGAHPVKTAGSNIQAGVSVDQVAARAFDGRTRLASLEIGCEEGLQSGDCDSGYSCAYSSNISWRTPATPMAKEIDPRLVFDRLFMLGSPDETAEARRERLMRRRSILDLVSSDAERLGRRLGARDRAKLEEYFDGLRAMEKRIDQVERVQGGEAEAGVARPAGTPADYREHLALMSDLLVLAFRLDITRVASFMIANEGSNRSFPFLGIADGHHHLSHHGGDASMIERVRQINRFQTEAFARMLDVMRGVEEDGGTLLDSTMVVWGGAISDGNVHNHDRLPVVVAGGRGCGIETGRHLAFDRARPLCDLHLAMLHRLGVDLPSFGDSSAPLPLG